ncbi:hypothetical protein CCR75_006621 [Bremia lactucae]|uniref:Secreted RxLR effector protein BLN03 n=1 Tax=Bremia lactucae TaxID=4779 RepID=BLN03_BRELC|nr:RecName: Full=Secreted RxLR effector protein BLN03; Flags: Precursor [Bremia lactucae]AYE92119.1 secreted RxLR-like effector [Bremia lactucae]TDH67208.1 hypothetical protein CCR75_006621 [Bremia lactucae]
MRPRKYIVVVLLSIAYTMCLAVGYPSDGTDDSTKSLKSGNRIRSHTPDIGTEERTLTWLKSMLRPSSSSAKVTKEIPEVVKSASDFKVRQTLSAITRKLGLHSQRLKRFASWLRKTGERLTRKKVYYAGYIAIVDSSSSQLKRLSVTYGSAFLFVIGFIVLLAFAMTAV